MRASDSSPVESVRYHESPQMLKWSLKIPWHRSGMKPSVTMRVARVLHFYGILAPVQSMVCAVFIWIQCNCTLCAPLKNALKFLTCFSKILFIYHRMLAIPFIHSNFPFVFKRICRSIIEVLWMIQHLYKRDFQQLPLHSFAALAAIIILSYRRWPKS